jgi:hypothetical protein
MQQVDVLTLRTHLQQPAALVWITTRVLSLQAAHRVVDEAALRLAIPVVAFGAEDAEHRDELIRLGAMVAPCLMAFVRGELWDRLLVRDVEDVVASLTPMLRRVRR